MADPTELEMPERPEGFSQEMWDAMTREYPPAVPEPCNDCPWRRNATKGWLGPHDAVDWTEQVHSDTPIACHQTIKDTDETGSGNWDHPAMRQCRGAAIFRANVAKSPRNQSIATGPTDHERVFSSNAEFVNYHERHDMEYEISISTGSREKLAGEFRRMADELEAGKEASWYIKGNGMDEPDISLTTEVIPEDGADDEPLAEWRRLS